MLEFVEELLDSQNNIIDQLKVLKENQKNKEVKKYIRTIVKNNNSPYTNYCINKYYFDKDTEEVKPPIRLLKPIYSLRGSKKIEKLLSSRDNLIDQIKLLKEYKGTKSIDTYVKRYLEYYANKYEEYCFQKYFYNMDVEEVEPTAKTLNITLYSVYYASAAIKAEREEKLHKNTIKKLKEGDKVIILDGPFKDITGIVKNISNTYESIVVKIVLFDQEYDIEHDGKVKKVKENKSEK